ncbi:hypothetical protein Nepgr_022818 [Nepenthes gracilis]|uniref:Uncharacterized protein n=1 Tax=Nepenthes gracilis TaxID=150966 RepID=A0AAD3T3A1_NEPGR|nr:hypothetical protein Nepgr_022818 [Nepenthes gracilis]
MSVPPPGHPRAMGYPPYRRPTVLSKKPRTQATISAVVSTIIRDIVEISSTPNLPGDEPTPRRSRRVSSGEVSASPRFAPRPSMRGAPKLKEKRDRRNLRLGRGGQGNGY